MDFADIREQLAPINGATFAAMDTITNPTIRGGRSNPFVGRVEKRTTGNRVLLFTNKNSNGYLNKVRRHLEAEGKDPDSFELSPRRWGQRIPDSPFVQHEDKHYLECIFLKAGDSHYFATDKISWFLDSGEEFVYALPDQEIPKDVLLRNGLVNDSGAEHQGLDNKVIVRTFCCDNIITLRAFGQEQQ